MSVPFVGLMIHGRGFHPSAGARELALRAGKCQHSDGSALSLLILDRPIQEGGERSYDLNATAHVDAGEAATVVRYRAFDRVTAAAQLDPDGPALIGEGMPCRVVDQLGYDHAHAPSFGFLQREQIGRASC